MGKKITGGLLLGLVVVCFALVGCSSDSDRIISPGSPDSIDNTSGFPQYGNDVTPDGWYQYEHDYGDENDLGGPSGDSDDNSHPGGNNDNDPDYEDVDQD